MEKGKRLTLRRENKEVSLLSYVVGAASKLEQSRYYLCVCVSIIKVDA